MKIENLTVKDARTIFLLSKNFSDAWNEEMLISGFERGNLKAKGYLQNGLLLAYILYTPAEDFCDLEMIFVDEGNRGNGIAQSLIKAMEDEVKNSSLKVMLEVRESNFSAIKLYDKMGYQSLSVRKKYYSDGENAVIMHKEF